MSRSLTDAVKAGNIAEVEIRLNMGEDLDQLEAPFYWSPLHWAVAGDHLHIANLLVSRGARVDLGDKEGNTALALAKREKRVKFVELLTSVGAKTTSTPCTLPVLEIKSDPLFRDPPPWSVSPMSTRQNGTLHTPVAPSSKSGPPKMFKTKQIDPSEYGPRPWSPPAALEVPAEPVLPKGGSPAVMRELVWRPVSRGPRPPSTSTQQPEQHLYCELEQQKEVRPVSQSSMASSFRMQQGDQQQASFLPEVDLTRCQSASDTWPVLTEDEQGLSNGVTNDSPSKLGESKVQSYMSNMLNSTKPSLSNMSSLLRPKKKDKEENTDEQRPLSQSSFGESVMSKGSTVKSYMSSVFTPKSKAENEEQEDETKSERPLSVVSGSQSLWSMGSTIKSHFTSGMHSPVAEEDDAGTEEVNEEKTKENGNVTDTLRSKGSSAKLYVSNFLKSKPSEAADENSATEKDPEKRSSSRFSNIFKTKPKSEESPPEAMTEKNVSSKFSSLLKFKSKSTESESTVERNIEPEKQKSSKLSETLKAKGSNAKSFMANVIHSKSKEESRSSGEADDPKSDEKSKVGEYVKSKGSAVRSYVSKVRGEKKQKQVVTTSTNDGTSKTSLFKQKGLASKNFVLNIFKRENGAGGAAGVASEVKKGAPASASIIGHYPKSFASTNKERSPETQLKSDTRGGSFPVKIDGFHTNVVNRTEKEMYEEEPIQRCSVREYVKKYEEQHQLSSGGSVRTECYTRPFKEFDGSNLSGEGGVSEPQVRLFGENNTGSRVSDHFSGNNHARQPDNARNQENKIKAGKETNDKEEKKGRHVGDTFTRFSDNVMRMKKDGVEKAEHSWTGMRRRVRRMKLVRALRRRSDAEEEGEDGKIYLKDGKGKAIKKLYTFRKSSS